jgi:L-ribulose-5-phosphate 3-epimerase
MRVGVSSYSFWHFRGAPYPLEQVLDDAARFGASGVEVLERQLEDVSVSRLHRLRRQALTLGLDLYAVSTHQDFVYPDAADRRKQIDSTVRSLDVAEALGAGVIRINSGRWKTIPKFDDLMAAEGKEPPLPGYTDEDAFGWVSESIAALLPEAERRGVVLGLENHWGLTFTAEGVRRILGRLPSSSYLGVVLDTGNFRERLYEQLEDLSRLDIVLVHGKSYVGGGEWYTLDIDWDRVGSILRGAGFRGYVSLEFEGKADPQEAVPPVIAMLRAKLER